MSFSTRFLTRRAAATALGLALTVSACDSNEPDDGGGEQEFITGVTVTMTNAAVASDVVTLTATIADGGGIVFSPARAMLRAGATYNATIRLVDAVNNTVVSEEVAEEAEDHLFRYTFTPAAAGTVTVTDRESQYGTNAVGTDLPVGLAFRVTTAAGATGNAAFNATLFHFEDPAGKSSATATSDERDIDIDFPVAFSGPTLTGNAPAN